MRGQPRQDQALPALRVAGHHAQCSHEVRMRAGRLHGGHFALRQAIAGNGPLEEFHRHVQGRALPRPPLRRVDVARCAFAQQGAGQSAGAGPDFIEGAALRCARRARDLGGGVARSPFSARSFLRSGTTTTFTSSSLSLRLETSIATRLTNPNKNNRFSL
jgi:hypothetical protein